MNKVIKTEMENCILYCFSIILKMLFQLAQTKWQAKLNS